MKKLVLVFMLFFITVGVFSQEIKNATSIAYIDVSTEKVFQTINGGDGFYSRIRISSTGSVAFYYVEMEDNKIIWAFTELGSMKELKDLGNNKYSYTVNGNKYIQGFMTLDGGSTVMWINATEMGDEGVSFIYELE